MTPPWTEFARRAALYRLLLERQIASHEAHVRWSETPNLYRERAVGNWDIAGLDGVKRRTKVTQIKDTAGVTFYTVGDSFRW